MDSSGGPFGSRAGQWAEFSAQQRLVHGLDCPEVSTCKGGGLLESLGT